MFPTGSLQKDKNDTKALYSPNQQPEPSQSPRTYGEIVPLFFSRYGAPIHMEGQYRGSHAFLLANGPSLKELDLTPLHKRWVMTLNNGTKTFQGNANCIVDDPSRFNLSTWLDPRVMKFIPMAHFEKPLWDNRMLRLHPESLQKWEPSLYRAGDCPNVVGYRRNEKFNHQRWLNEDTINWGNHAKHGGGRSVMLASLRILYSLGFRSVYLLGVDFDMSTERKYHFAEHRTSGSIQANLSTYAKLQRHFSELQPHFVKNGFLVWNCNADSKLTAFPHLPYSAALEASTSFIGDVNDSKTDGMYQSWEDKISTATSQSGRSPES